MLIFMVTFLAYHSHAQDSRIITSVNLQANNSYQFLSSKSPVNSFYSLGGQVTVFLMDKYYVGFSQSGSLAPSDLLKSSELIPNKVRQYTYALNGGMKSKLGSNLYLLAGLRGGLGMISLGSVNKVDGINEFISKENTQTYLVAPEVKVGVQLHKYFAIEAGANYNKYFGSNEKWGISPEDFDSFGATLSLVGRIPLN